MTHNSTKIYILADDLTGALDSGVQLSKKGDQVLITLDTHRPFEKIDGADVLVIDTETRHIEAKAAYQKVYELIRQAKESGIKKIYKKTDSGLRGNVGAELTAFLDAYEAEKIDFVPAWPKMQRITVNGVHYVNGVPLSESIFSRDVVDPVSESEIEKLIRRQSNAAISHHETNKEEKGIVIYDCQSDEELEEIAGKLFAPEKESFLLAGCAGLLEKFPDKKIDQNNSSVQLNPKLVVLSGSMNDVTKAQLEKAQKDGAYRVHIPMQKVACDSWKEEEIASFATDFLKKASGDIAIIDTMDSFEEVNITRGSLSFQIAWYMGLLCEKLIDQGMDATLMIIGGDTLLGVVNQLDITTLRPIREMESGIVLSAYQRQDVEGYIITKSGGFGSEALLKKIQENLKEDSVCH